MKKEFYLYKRNGGIGVLIRDNGDIVDGVSPFGTIELDVRPVKKEVEKEIRLYVGELAGEDIDLTVRIPAGACDAKVVYKIKQ